MNHLLALIKLHWLRICIHRRAQHIRELNDHLKRHCDSDIALYVLELRDRNRIDECQVAALRRSHGNAH